MKSRQFARGFSNFNPRSPDGERPRTFSTTIYEVMISIHAPRMGSDKIQNSTLSCKKISIHAPRMGSDFRHPFVCSFHIYFNPRSPDGERPFVHGWWQPPPTISIHAPRMGSDAATEINRLWPQLFQSTLPGWGATVADAALAQDEHVISIHAPRMGSDRENGHLRPRYGQNHLFSTLIVSQIVIDVLGTVRKSQKTPAH